MVTVKNKLNIMRHDADNVKVSTLKDTHTSEIIETPTKELFRQPVTYRNPENEKV